MAAKPAVTNHEKTPWLRGLPPLSLASPNGRNVRRLRDQQALLTGHFQLGSGSRRPSQAVTRLQSELGLGHTLGAVAADSVIVREHEVGNARHDLGTKPRTVEHAVMAHGRLQPVRLALRRDVDAELVRRLGLTDAGYVVVLALHRHQGDAADLRGIDANAAMHHRALGERVTHEHSLHRL